MRRELFTHYSDLCNQIRRLLLTQTFVWLAAFVYFWAEKAEGARIAHLILPAAVAAAAFTFALGVTHRYLHQFLDVIVENAESDSELSTSEKELWRMLRTRRKEQWLRRIMVDYPDAIPILSYIGAAIILAK